MKYTLNESMVGINGIEKIMELSLNEDEKEKFHASVDAVRKVNGELKF